MGDPLVIGVINKSGFETGIGRARAATGVDGGVTSVREQSAFSISRRHVRERAIQSPQSRCIAIAKAVYDKYASKKKKKNPDSSRDPTPSTAKVIKIGPVNVLERAMTNIGNLLGPNGKTHNFVT